jgi:hypothetical protein
VSSIDEITEFQAACQHPGDVVRADALQGDVSGVRLQWCYACGAYRVGHVAKDEDYPKAFSGRERPNVRDASKLGSGKKP